MSGFHRISGAALYFGMLLIAWWLVAAASGPNAYANFEWFMGSLIGRLVLFGYTWALLHHMLGGVRHLIWDTSTASSRPSANYWRWRPSSARSRSRSSSGWSAISPWEARDERT